jgi:hypothetical protein
LVTVNIYNENGIITSINIESDNKIIASGISYFTFIGHFATARYNTNGTLDSSFGVGGVASFNFDRYSESYASAIQADQKILVAGNTSSYNYATSIIIRYNNDVVLPLTFLSFTATKQTNTVLLNWQISNESSNNYFSVQRSNAKNKEFVEIYKVYSKGYSLPGQSYTTTDTKPLQGWNYYRLKQVDDDGKFNYSRITSVLFDNNGTMVLYPNPTDDFIYIDGLQEGVKSDLFITDVNGKKVAIANTTQSMYKFNTKNLTNGIYYITIVAGGKTLKRKFIKQ